MALEKREAEYRKAVFLLARMLILHGYPDKYKDYVKLYAELLDECYEAVQASGFLDYCAFVEEHRGAGVMREKEAKGYRGSRLGCQADAVLGLIQDAFTVADALRQAAT